MALSQLIPQLQIGYIFTYFAPLAFVLLVTMAKEASDDFKRFKRDQEVNAQLFQRLTRDSPTGFESVQSADIRCGDLIRLEKDQRVPADMVLLRTSERSGSCFLRTDQLDGETDWKLRVAVGQTQHLPSDLSLLDYQAVLRFDHPHKDIHTFVGSFYRTAPMSATASPTAPLITTGTAASGIGVGSTTVQPLLKSALAEPLTVDNALWANTVLASGTAIGVVVYTGKDTRAVMNTSQPDSKIGLFDLEINRISKILCVFTFLLALTLIALNRFQGLWYIYLMRFLIIFSSIIPIR